MASIASRYVSERVCSWPHESLITDYTAYVHRILVPNLCVSLCRPPSPSLTHSHSFDPLPVTFRIVWRTILYGMDMHVTYQSIMPNDWINLFISPHFSLAHSLSLYLVLVRSLSWWVSWWFRQVKYATKAKNAATVFRFIFHRFKSKKLHNK